MKNETIEKAIQILGSQGSLAAASGASQTLVSLWLNGQRKVGAEYCIPIETATEGAVTRHDLRPDIYPLQEERVL